MFVHVNLLNFVRARNSLKFNEVTTLGLIFRFGVFFRKCVLPEGLATQPPQMWEIRQSLELIDVT